MRVLWDMALGLIVWIGSFCIGVMLICAVIFAVWRIVEAVY